ncbi:HMG-box [Marasmius fiardii PR-910]|nr:HMG-box [Marasmius fiardii PR-910]
MDTSLTFKALDPNDTPKRPLNAFMIFARDRRPQVTSENPFIRTGEISKILSREWNSKPPHDKRLYEVQARQMKDKFVTRYPDYVYRRRPNNSRKRRRTDHTIVIDHSHDIASQDQSSSFVDPADVSIQGADLGEGPSRSQGSGGGQGIGNFDGPG